MMIIPKSKPVTRTMGMTSVDVVVVLALVLALHGTAAAVRRAARQMADKVCMEQQPGMKRLAKVEDDAKVMAAATNIVQRATDQLGILPGQPFPVGKLAA